MKLLCIHIPTPCHRRVCATLWTLACLGGAFFASVCASAEDAWVSASAEVSFTTDTSEAEACQDAELRARREAVSSRAPALLSATQTEVCKEPTDSAPCVGGSTILVEQQGLITSVRNLQRLLRDEPIAHWRTCVVRLEAKIGEVAGEGDPGFDFAAELNGKAVFHDGEEVQLAVRPSAPMHVAIFLWAPSSGDVNAVTRIYPNDLDPDVSIDGPHKIPSDEARQRYALVAQAPEGRSSRLAFEEFLLVIATRQKVAFLKDYRLEELNARLLELSPRDLRVRRLGYIVARSR